MSMMLGQGSFDLVRVPTQPGLVRWLCWLHNLGPGASPVKLPGTVCARQSCQTGLADSSHGGRGAEGYSQMGSTEMWGAGHLWEILLQASKAAISVTPISLLTLWL